MKSAQVASVPRTLADDKDATAYLADMRWPKGVRCVLCGQGDRISRGRSKGSFRCKDCGRDFRVTSQTVFARTHLPANKLVTALLLYAYEGSKLSSVRLSSELAITQKTAWRLLQKIQSEWPSALGSGPAERAVRAKRAVSAPLFPQERFKKLVRRTINGESEPASTPKRVICGDALEHMRSLPSSEPFDVIIADPPYNIGKDFGNNNDRMDLEEYAKWSEEWLGECFRLISPHGLIYTYGFPEILARIAVRFPVDKQRWLAWHYTNKTVPHLKFWQRSHESILCMWKGDRPNLHIDAIREGYSASYRNCMGRPRKNTVGRFSNGIGYSVYGGHENGALPRDVIKIPALAGGAGRSERWFMCRTCGGKVFPPRQLNKHRDCDILKHPTQKPRNLSEKLIRSVVAEGQKGRLLVPFAGSGSECVTAAQLGVDFLGIEYNSEYVDFARKWLRHGDT